MGWVSRRWEVDHGGLSGGAHREPQEQRAAPQLCVGRSVTRDRPSTYVILLGAASKSWRSVPRAFISLREYASDTTRPMGVDPHGFFQGLGM